MAMLLASDAAGGHRRAPGVDGGAARSLLRSAPTPLRPGGRRRRQDSGDRPTDAPVQNLAELGDVPAAAIDSAESRSQDPGCRICRDSAPT